VNFKVLDRHGAGTDSMVITAIQHAIALKSKYNIKIINLSLGRPVMESYTLDPLCRRWSRHGRRALWWLWPPAMTGANNTAGTSGYGTIAAPGNDPYVITVGAMKDMNTNSRADDQMTSYSSKGPTLFDHLVKPDLVAPGNKIISTVPTALELTNSYPGNRVDTSYYVKGGTSQLSIYYFELSGTSMATPMVAGAAALLLQKQPSLTPDQVKAILMKTATKNFPSAP